MPAMRQPPLLLLLLAASCPALSLALPPLPASCSGTVNALPLVDGSAAPVEARVAHGSKRVLRGGNLSAPLTILHLYGNTSEMNAAYGALMREEMAALVPATLAYIYAQVNASYNLSWLPEPVRDWVVEYGVETALDWTANASLPFTPPHWQDALAALAAGSGQSLADVRRVAMIAEWTRAQCSMLGAWGPASASGKLAQLRALDWDTDGPFQRFPVLAVYHPDARAGGHAHATLGWAGMTGAITGVSSAGVGLSEKVWDAYTGAWSPFGYAWNFLFQDALQFDRDGDEVLSRIASANRTCSVWLGVGDAHGNEGGGAFRIVAYSHQTVNIFNDRNFVPYANHDAYKDLLFINKHVQPSDEPCMNDIVKAAYGALDGRALAQYVAAGEQTGDMHIATYDWAADELIVANASPDGTQLAYDAPLVRFSMSALWAQTL
jgi:hypothetical protein